MTLKAVVSRHGYPFKSSNLLFLSPERRIISISVNMNVENLFQAYMAGIINLESCINHSRGESKYPGFKEAGELLLVDTV